MEKQIDPGRSKGRFLGSPGGRGADFRPYLADFVPQFNTLATPAGCGGCFWLKEPPLDGPWSPYLIILLDF